MLNEINQTQKTKDFVSYSYVKKGDLIGLRESQQRLRRVGGRVGVGRERFMIGNKYKVRYKV